MELRLLGGLALDGLASASTPLERPQSTALLAYLLLGSPNGYHQRDTLTGLFWPDSNHERARASLRKALYRLRKDLGDGVIVNRGRGRVGVEPGDIWCDAAELLAASAAGDHERVVSLYRGELMPGFFLSDTPGFERWLHSRRVRLRDRAQEAALALADEAEEEGRLAESLFWLERAEGISRGSERVVRRMMELRASLGDRTEALRKYGEHVERLERELQIEPGTEIQRLAQQIRDGGGSLARTASAVGSSTPPAGDPGVGGSAEAGTEDRFRKLLDTLPDVIYETDASGHLTYVNRAGARLAGLPRERLIGMHCQDLVREDHKDRLLEFYLRQIEERTPETYCEFPCVAADGREVWIGQHVRLVVREGDVVGARAVARDVTVRKRLDEARRNLTVRDPDTGLHNARAFSLFARERWQLARRLELALTLVVVTVENDDRIHENGGGGTVARSLVRAARVVCASCRDSDVVGRLDRSRLGVLAVGSPEVIEEGLYERVEASVRTVEGIDGDSSAPPPVLSLRARELREEDLEDLVSAAGDGV